MGLVKEESKRKATEDPNSPIDAKRIKRSDSQQSDKQDSPIKDEEGPPGVVTTFPIKVRSALHL